jgi:sugar phosphate isomerase/epimerase
MNHVLSTHVFIQNRLTTVWLDRIWEAGIPEVEIFCARPHLDWYDKAQVNELGHWFADAPLKLHSVHSPIFTDDVWGRSGPHSVITLTELSKPKRLGMVDEIKRALEIAEKIPFKFLIQHLGVSGEEYDERKLDAAFAALEELSLFAKSRGVEILLENIPNRLSSAERLLHFLEITHLDLGFCFDTGHAHIMEGLETAFELMAPRIRSTHVHDNDGEHDVHRYPFLGDDGTIDWKKAMDLLRSRPGQYPLLLELREVPEIPNPIEGARQVFERLENL